MNFSKSINLALSERGINGLRNLGDNGKLMDDILAETIPMYGRMIHSGRVGEKGQSQKYDVHGRVFIAQPPFYSTLVVAGWLADGGVGGSSSVPQIEPDLMFNYWTLWQCRM